MKLLLDTTILGQLCHSTKTINQTYNAGLVRLLSVDPAEMTVFLPGICDYELRRKLLHLVAIGKAHSKSIKRLDELRIVLRFLPIDSAIMLQAAKFWAESRLRGTPTSSSAGLDGDVILAATAALMGGTVVTSNERHLAQFVPTARWEEVSG